MSASHPHAGNALPRVVITGIGLTSPNGNDLASFRKNLLNKVSGVRPWEIRHVGARDAAKAIGGVGPCGLQLCCNTFLADFAPVSIRHAKEQGLALKPERVSGVCGRLMCCLVYEDAFYRSQRSLFPKPGKRVLTPKGEGRVRDVDVLARTVRVALTDAGVETFPVDALLPAAPPAAGTPPAPP